MIDAVQGATSRPGAELRARSYLIVLEETVAGCRQTDLGQLVPPSIRDVPRNDRGHAAEEFLDHDVIVEHRRHQHNVPQQLLQRHRHEEAAQIRRERPMRLLQELEISVGEITQRAAARLGRRGSRVLLAHYQILDTLPSYQGGAFLREDQTGVDQDERVAGYVETAPESTRLQAPRLRVHDLNVAGVQTPAVSGLDVVEQLRPCEPGDGGDDDTGQVSQQDRPTTAAQRVRRQGDPGYDHREQPAPAPLDEVLIQGIVGPGEVSTWHRDEVRDQRDDEYRAAVDRDLEPSVEQQRLLAQV